MKNLDNLGQMKKMDPGKVLPSIEALASQLKQAWQEIKKVKIPKNFRQIDKIIINGMGGSGLGGHIVRSLFYDQLKYPVGLINSYQLPALVDKKTLYLLSSYSGATEEPLATRLAAQKRQAKIFGLAGGGALGRLIENHAISGYAFKPLYNPSNQPRLGLGYSLGAQLGLFKRLGLIKLADAEIVGSLNQLPKFQAKFGAACPAAKNPAKKMALNLYGKAPMIVASEFLAGNAHVLANQINETAKNFAAYFLLPELNHHLLEGLINPKTNRQYLAFVFFESAQYCPKNQIRYGVTKQVMAKNKISCFGYRLLGRDKLSQALEMLMFGSYVSFYLAMLNGLNPSKIPWVDYFKKELKKRA